MSLVNYFNCHLCKNVPGMLASERTFSQPTGIRENICSGELAKA